MIPYNATEKKNDILEILFLVTVELQYANVIDGVPSQPFILFEIIIG